MVFSSIIFLFIFLPVVLGGYYISKTEYRNLILLAASIVFYAYGERRFVVVMVCLIAVNFFFALAMEKFPFKKVLLAGAVISDLGILFVYKYLGFTASTINALFRLNLPVPEIALPIGISFFTFQAMSYVIDVYRGKARVNHSILDLGLYISLFPQLIAGPIVRYNTIEAQLSNRICTVTKFEKGVKRFIAGFCKKVLLANNIALVTEYYFAQAPETLSLIGAWIGAISFTLQIYYDFSGYSDMAIGLGELFGFEFEENFNYPYIASSVTDFWRRWHISLSKWFRDYVYIPLGGSRVSAGRHIFNLAVVWLLTGIWHGANLSFLFWGMLYFVALACEKYIIKPENKGKLFQLIYRIPVILFVNFAWVIFKAEDIKKGISYWLSMFGFYHNKLFDDQVKYMLREYGFFLLAGCVLAVPVIAWISERVKLPGMTSISKYVKPIIYMAGLLWAVSYLILGAHNPFIYFNF